MSNAKEIDQYVKWLTEKDVRRILKELLKGDVTIDDIKEDIAYQ